MEESSIIKEMYQMRNKKADSLIQEDLEEYNGIIEGITDILEEKFTNEEVSDILNKMYDYADFWGERYYKLGIADGLNLQKETTNIK